MNMKYGYRKLLCNQPSPNCCSINEVVIKLQIKLFNQLFTNFLKLIPDEGPSLQMLNTILSPG